MTNQIIKFTAEEAVMNYSTSRHWNI